jgi:hypothetical protein
MRDYQKQHVYDWERAFVFPKMPSNETDTHSLRIIVGYIWNELGLLNPPDVVLNERYKRVSTGSRYRIQLAHWGLNEKILIHELAHSLNGLETFEPCDGHGPNYVATYCHLLTRFYKFEQSYLLYTLKKSDVDINMGRLLDFK